MVADPGLTIDLYKPSEAGQAFRSEGLVSAARVDRNPIPNCTRPCNLPLTSIRMLTVQRLTIAGIPKWGRT
jgi:hypothetical protein